MIRFLQRIFQEHYLLLLILLVIISYGQMLGMYVWQDDNGLFFKLAHIDEKAGYLGAGPFGTGAYKYIQTPYIPIYQLFGFNTVAFFSFTLAFYLLTTVIVYKVFSHIFEEKVGRLGGLLYASGYIASDGFIRLFNSMITSVSIILISLMLLFYWKFFKERNLKWYSLSLLFFFLAIEFAVGRTHYLIGVIVSFELIFLTFEKKVRSLLSSFLRLIPFGAIFYHYYIFNGDHRSGQVKSLFLDLSKGEFYQLYSFLTSLLNVVIPDWLTRSLLSLNINPNTFSWIVVSLSMGLVYLLLRNKPYQKIIIPVFFLFLLLWKILVNDLFSNQVLNLSSAQIFLVFLGGLILILIPVIFIALQQYRKMYLFLVLWVMLNIGAYAAYNPTVSYESVNRYLAHSYFAWIGVLLVLYQAVSKNPWKKVVLTLIIFWGLGNLVTSVFYQNNILKERSNPPRNFYNQLKTYLPEVKKGDVFYFDVAERDLRYFDDAFSVASMPETTAIAWRYGIDRYDITRFTNFDELTTYLKSKKVAPEKIHTFWYEGQQLVNTSDTIRKNLFDTNPARPIAFIQEDLTIIFQDEVLSSIPVELTLEIEASPKDSRELTFPLLDSLVSSNPIYNDDKLKQSAVALSKYKEGLFKRAKFSSSSEWRERITSNLSDQNLDTYWQADRVLWQKRNESITLDLGVQELINRLVWVNGFGNNTPTKYQVEVSNDGNNWKVVKQENLVRRVDNKDPQVIEFEPQQTQYVRMVITDTLGGDSPTIAEVWVVPTQFKDLKINEVQDFISNPFRMVNSPQDYNNLLKLFENEGVAEVYWLNNKKGDFQTNFQKVDIIYDGQLRTIKINIPAGGTKLEKIRFLHQIPGNIIIRKVTAKNLNLNEIF